MHRLKPGQGTLRGQGHWTGMQPNKGEGAEENNETRKHLTAEKIDPKVSAENCDNVLLVALEIS